MSSDSAALVLAAVRRAGVHGIRPADLGRNANIGIRRRRVLTAALQRHGLIERRGPMFIALPPHDDEARRLKRVRQEVQTEMRTKVVS